MKRSNTLVMALIFGWASSHGVFARTQGQARTDFGVLLMAHGGTPEWDNEVLAAVRQALPFRRVEVMTLREDWPEKRPAAEQRIKAFMATAKAEGGAAIVLPFRLQGFGPYAEVLEGLDYVSDGHGLLPHANVTRWVEEQIKGLEAGPFRPPVAR